MEWFLARAVIALAGSLVAAVQDAKTSFIDDNVLYALVAAGALLDLLSFDWALIQAALAGSVVIGVAGYFSWRAGQLGSGDVLLFLGLHLLFPVSDGLVPWPVASILVAASFFALVGSAAWYSVRLVQEKAPLKREAMVFLSLLALSVVFVGLLPLSLAQKAFFILFFAGALFTLVFKQAVMDFVVIKKIRLSEVEDEDILATEKMPVRVVEKYSLSRLLTGEEVKKLKLVSLKEKIRLFPVCKELPRFGPYVFAGLLSYLLAGDLLAFLFL